MKLNVTHRNKFEVDNILRILILAGREAGEQNWDVQLHEIETMMIDKPVMVGQQK